jgi:hypothetical protein
MSCLKIILLVATSIALNACTIYKSPDRKDFESLSASFKIASLEIQSCSENSVKPMAQSSRLVSVENSDPSKPLFLWEHSINNEPVFESDDLNLTYCLYEII